MLKEKGYDEFLMKKIRKGYSDAEAKRVLTPEESRLKARQAIERKLVELAEYEQQENAYA